MNPKQFLLLTLPLHALDVACTAGMTKYGDYQLTSSNHHCNCRCDVSPLHRFHSRIGSKARCCVPWYRFQHAAGPWQECIAAICCPHVTVAQHAIDVCLREPLVCLQEVVRRNLQPAVLRMRACLSMHLPRCTYMCSMPDAAHSSLLSALCLCRRVAATAARASQAVPV